MGWYSGAWTCKVGRGLFQVKHYAACSVILPRSET
jgi:hypothetical protein